MTIRVAINGLGRIGRCLVRALYEKKPIPYRDLYPEWAFIEHYRDAIELVAINELASPEMIVHLLKYDSSHGLFPSDIAWEPVESLNSFQRKGSYAGQTRSEGSKRIKAELTILQDKIALFQESNAELLPWKDLDIDVVLECSGRLKSKQDCLMHVNAGAKKLLLSNPGYSDVDATIVFGINHQEIHPEHQVISSASCTTNCLVPILSTLHNALNVQQGKVTTIHSAMNDQPVIDAYDQDFRKARSAGQSIIPVSTGLARGVSRIMPELAGVIEAQAIRVPTTNVSVMDIVLQVGEMTSAEAVNDILRRASTKHLQGLLGFTQELLVSCDFNHDGRSCVVDAAQTRVTCPKADGSKESGSLVSVLAWFDNEWAYANRMLDNTLMMFKP